MLNEQKPPSRQKNLKGHTAADENQASNSYSKLGSLTHARAGQLSQRSVLGSSVIFFLLYMKKRCGDKRAKKKEKHNM
jgi:hypothetical protein